MGGAWAASDYDASLEYSVKAAYLLRFGGFVEWPADSFSRLDEPFVIGVLGEDPFGTTLDRIVATHTVQGRPVIVKRFAKVEQVRGVHVLYISRSEKERLPAITAQLNERNVLTVADADLPGVIVNFVIDGNRVRFEINLDQAERTGLKVSSRLLNVARAVRTSGS